MLSEKLQNNFRKDSACAKDVGPPKCFAGLSKYSGYEPPYSVSKVIFNDYSSTYNQLLDKYGTVCVKTQRINSMLINVFKLYTYPNYLRTMFTSRTSKYSLKGTNVLTLSKDKHFTHDLNQIKLWCKVIIYE